MSAGFSLTFDLNVPINFQETSSNATGKVSCFFLFHLRFSEVLLEQLFCFLFSAFSFYLVYINLNEDIISS